MNYHIIVDDKFFNDYINEVEKVSKNKKNRYLVRQTVDNAKYINHPKAEWLGYVNDKPFVDVLNCITKNDRIFVHWYDISVGLKMLSIPRDVTVYASIMGGDFYEEPMIYNSPYIYEKITKKLFFKNFVYPPIWARRPDFLLKQLIRIYKTKRKSFKDFELKKKTIQRINYFLVGKEMSNEVEIANKKYNTNIGFKFFTYNQNFDLANNLKSFIKEQPYVTIQIGNSSNYSNNHLDILNKISRFSNKDLKIILPLSYGDFNYREVVKTHYKEVFGEKVQFVEQFLTRDIYVRSLQEIDICIMFHIRSQALGNCITLITLGKKLYLKERNPIYSMLKNMGVIVFNADAIGKTTFEELKTPLSESEINNNRKKLLEAFSEKRRLEDLSNLINS